MLREADAEWELKASSAGTERPRVPRPGSTSGWNPLSFGVGGNSRSLRNTPGGGGLESCRPPLEPGARSAARCHGDRRGAGPKAAPQQSAPSQAGAALFPAAPGALGGSSGSRLRAPPVAYLLRWAREASSVGQGSPGCGASGRAAGAELRGGGREGRGARAAGDTPTPSTRKRAGEFARLP